MAAEGLDQVAETIRRVSTDMQAEQPQIANVATTAADQAESSPVPARDGRAPDHRQRRERRSPAAAPLLGRGIRARRGRLPIHQGRRRRRQERRGRVPIRLQRRLPSGAASDFRSSDS